MKSADLDSLKPLEMPPLMLPEPGVDVMRVRLEETYDVEGVGRDTVQLKGWIAVRHDNTRPAEGEHELTWNSAITDTEFVAMKLDGVSKIFGRVEVTLDTTTPSIGQVGKLCLPFAVGSSLDAAYMPHRTLFKIDEVAANRPQGSPYELVQSKPPATTTTLVTGDRAKPVEAIIDGVIRAISAKDPKAMMRYYSPSGNNLFFGQTKAGVVRGGDAYVRELGKVFANIKSIEVKRNEIQVRTSGNLAVAAVTGVNNVVNSAGQSGSSPWRWTVELERGSGGGWQITHDHLSFFEDPNSPIERQQVSALAARGACCLAAISANVAMLDLKLQMRTAEALQWYSEVETIPPVGRTASVSATPVPLVSNGRQVGTLTHGTVNFREVVRHVPLIDVTRPELRVASIRVPTAGGSR